MLSRKKAQRIRQDLQDQQDRFFFSDFLKKSEKFQPPLAALVFIQETIQFLPFFIR
jgi:hypothetical protein